MLATIPRAGRRAMATTSALRAPLAAPYEHVMRSSLAAPYDQHLENATASSSSLRAPYTFKLAARDVDVFPPPPAPVEWAAATLSTDEGRQWALESWDKCLIELAEQAEISTPEISFQALSSTLAGQDVPGAIKRAGGVVVRDVVRDRQAEAWAAEMAASGREQPFFHHPAQVAARTNVSVLSATQSVLKALFDSCPEGAYLRIDASAPTPSKQTWAAKSLWDLDPNARVTPLHAHLALQPTTFAVPSSSAAATYALLRPFFTPVRSRISFYKSGDYLVSSNWSFNPSPAEVDASVELPHVKTKDIQLGSGDILVTHAGLRLAAKDNSGLVLPVHPLPATPGNEAFVAAQRDAFESGLPPPHALSLDGSSVKVEDAGDVSWIESHSGRKAMGY